MKNSQAVHDAMQEAFTELLALSPEKLRDRLKKREVGPIGKLMRESQNIEIFFQECQCADNKSSHQFGQIHIEDICVDSPRVDVLLNRNQAQYSYKVTSDDNRLLAA